MADFTTTALTTKKITARLFKFTGYIHNRKILPGNIFGLILKNKMAATVVFFRLSARSFVGPLEQRVLQAEISHLQDVFIIKKSRLGIFFNLILKNTRWPPQVFLCQSCKVLVSTLLLVLEVSYVKPTYRKSWARNLLVWSDLTLGPSFKVKRG